MAEALRALRVDVSTNELDDNRDRKYQRVLDGEAPVRQPARVWGREQQVVGWDSL